jgi:Kef-type K+ transport system membrane component KefB
MPTFSFDGVLVIAVVAVVVPLVLALVPRVPIPQAVVEVVAGIVIGPAVLGWVHIDAPILVLSDLGLGMLLFLAGLEIDVQRVRGAVGRLAGVAFLGSAVLAVACGYLLDVSGVVKKPLFIAIIIVSTSAGLLLPLLKDAGEQDTTLGQLVMAAGALAEVGPVMMLSLFYSATSNSASDRFISLAMFLALVAVTGLALARVRRLERLENLLDRLEDRSAQLRVRAALTLALAFGTLAYRFGFASILGAFAAGLLVRVVDLTGKPPHTQFQTKLEGIGFGFLIPIFFIATGVQFDLHAVTKSTTAILEIPLFLLAILVVRATPALFYVRRLGRRGAAVAGLSQATTLTFVIVATQIGLLSGQLDQRTAASVLAAGLLSAAIFPAVAVKLLESRPSIDESPGLST